MTQDSRKECRRPPSLRMDDLAIAVIELAIDDMFCRDQRLRAQACGWLLEPNEDFEIWCGVAGTRPQEIRKRVRAMREGRHKRRLHTSPKNPPTGSGVCDVV